MTKSKEARPFPQSSSFSSLVSQTTLTDSQDIAEKYEHHSTFDTNPPYSEHDESSSHSVATPLSVDLTTMWHVQTPPIITSANHHHCFTSNTTLQRKKALRENVSYFETSAQHSQPSHSAYDIIPMPHESLYNDGEEEEEGSLDRQHYMDETPASTASPHKAAALFSFHIEMKKKIICVLGQSLINGGCPVYRADEVLKHCARLLDMDASFTFLPDSIMVTFFLHPKKKEKRRVHSMMVKASPSFDTGKLGRINHVMNQFLFRHHHQQDEDNVGFNYFDHCLQSLYAVMDDPPTCGFFGTLIGFSLSAFSGCILLFNGSWVDAALSGVLGGVVGLLSILSSRYPIYGRVFELSSSVIVAIFARALHRYCCFSSVGVSAILILLPGYTMTIAVMELSARQINTGTIRLVYAVVYAFVLAYGLQVGSSMYSAIDPTASDIGVCQDPKNPPPISPWFFIPLFPIMSISIALSFGSNRHQWLTQTLCAAVGYCPAFFLAKVIPDSQIVGSISAFAVGLYANFALKITGEAPLVPLCVGVTLLVPGSIGVRGAYSLLHQDGVSHESFPIQMLTICLGIVAGLFAAAMIVYPSGKRRSLYVSL
ncbi:hypothetical protein BC941DRAFT_429256 [Chlamydoabsidia padenii]|nr:hypothetical protein BC941DRAFT_429256 [Chlamydoabsidia padenii]